MSISVKDEFNLFGDYSQFFALVGNTNQLRLGYLHFSLIFKRKTSSNVFGNMPLVFHPLLVFLQLWAEMLLNHQAWTSCQNSD